jgi:hypothetical protein
MLEMKLLLPSEKVKINRIAIKGLAKRVNPCSDSGIPKTLCSIYIVGSNQELNLDFVVSHK